MTLCVVLVWWELLRPAAISNRFTNRAGNLGGPIEMAVKETSTLHSRCQKAQRHLTIWTTGEDAKTKGRMENLPNYFQKRTESGKPVLSLDVLNILSNPKRAVLVLMWVEQQPFTNNRFHSPCFTLSVLGANEPPNNAKGYTELKQKTSFLADVWAECYEINSGGVLLLEAEKL